MRCSTIRSCLLGALALAAGGCATTQGPADPRDPWEGYNRAVYQFNDTVDRYVLKPAAKGYEKVTPQGIEIAIGSFFSNLGDVGIAVNNLLQLKPLDAMSDIGRIAINTTLGMGGLFDIAARWGLPKHEEDFGQTLGYWGVGSGPYFVVPFLGPSTVRDAPSTVVDGYLNPISYLDDELLLISLYGLDIVDSRAALFDAEETLDQFAFDRYASLRNAFLERRQFLVYDGRPPESSDDDLKQQLEGLE